MDELSKVMYAVGFLFNGIIITGKFFNSFWGWTSFIGISYFVKKISESWPATFGITFLIILILEFGVIIYALITKPKNHQPPSLES